MKMLKWYEWVYAILCVIMCIGAFIDGEYLLGVVFVAITILGAIGTIKSKLDK